MEQWRRKVDITDKLSFDGNPSLSSRVRCWRSMQMPHTMLKVMGLMSADGPRDGRKFVQCLRPDVPRRVQEEDRKD
ncbi:MAG: hypothetical protein ACLTBV_18710 [Enterocloster bolteae]